MNNIIQALCILIFNDSAISGVVVNALYLAGVWGILVKSGIEGWWALIPGARDYQLARCAGRESEGKGYSLSGVAMIALKMITMFALTLTEDSAGLVVFILVLQIALWLVRFVYALRVWGGLFQVYNLRRRWIILCLSGYLRWIPALLLGWKKKYQPEWQVEDIRAELARLASSGSASVMDEGLSVNLKDRTVTEFFQKKVLLRDIHMNIPQGHMVLLLGGSGAGKTTYLNAINGYEKANAEVKLNGTDMYKQYRKMQYEIGFVPQSEMMRGKDTVLSTLLDAAKLRLPKDVSAKQRRQRVDEVMDIFGLKPVKNNLVEKLSGGQKKRLSISMEFISNPSLFILDEPDSGLDGVMARELFEQLRKIADTGKIVIVITHTPDRVIDLFDDVIVLAKDSARTGRLAWYGSIEDARQFFGREKMEQIVKSVNRKEEGGDGLADEFVMKYAKEVA